MHMYLYVRIYVYIHAPRRYNRRWIVSRRALPSHVATRRSTAAPYWKGRRTIGPTRVHVIADVDGANQVFGLAVPAILVYVVGFQLCKVRVPVAARKRPLRVPGARRQVVVVYNVARSGKLQDPGMLAKCVSRVPP